MAGLAALISCPPSAADALAEALAVRGSDQARHRAGPVTLLVRAALPIVHEVDGCTAVVDGIAELSALLSAYRSRGPAGLLGGAEAYALILRDPHRRGLVLARNGDGPPLYYARSAGGLLVASEPEALLAAGISGRPDDDVVAAFLASGACEQSARTFYAEIRRVLPGQVLAVDAEVTDHTPAARGAQRPRPLSARVALRWAVDDGRIGVRLSGSAAGAAILAAALARGQDAAVPVYSNRFPGLDDAATEHAAALLGPLPEGAVRHRALPFFADALDLDGFLADVGEPLPDLDNYLVWATAKATAGEVDALLDAATPADHLARLADRVRSRYGVELRFPRCGAHADADWAALARETLPTPVAEREVLPPIGGLLARVGPDLAAAIVHGQPAGQQRAAVDELGALLGGRRADAEVVFRRLVLAHWLRLHSRASAPLHSRASAPLHSRASAPPQRPVAEAVVAGRTWRRVPVPTELLHPGDPLPEKVAWYVAEAAAELPPGQPWYALIAAKAVAVTQGRARGVWEIRPGWTARTIAAIRGTAPWVEQVVVDHGGRARALTSAVAARLRLRSLAARLTTADMRGISGPRPHAAGLAQVSVVAPPRFGDEVARELRDTLAKVLADAELAGLAGCAVIGVDPAGVRLAGWHGDGDPAVAVALAEGDPFGPDDRCTPVVLAAAQPVKEPRPAKRGARKSRRS